MKGGQGQNGALSELFDVHPSEQRVGVGEGDVSLEGRGHSK